jgi:hypothetical protein
MARTAQTKYTRHAVQEIIHDREMGKNIIGAQLTMAPNLTFG